MPINDMVSANLGVYDMYGLWFFYIHGKYVQFHEASGGKSSAVCDSVHCREYTICGIYMLLVRAIGTSEVNVRNY